MFATSMGSDLGLLALKLLFALLMVLILTNTIEYVIRSVTPVLPASRVQSAQNAPLPVPEIASGGVLQQVGAAPARRPGLIEHDIGTVIGDPAHRMPASGPPTPQEIRESRRRADEAARIIEASTPEI